MQADKGETSGKAVFWGRFKCELLLVPHGFLEGFLKTKMTQGLKHSLQTELEQILTQGKWKKRQQGKLKNLKLVEALV